MERKSALKRASDVRSLLQEYYEEGRHDRCKLWVYRNYVYPRFGICKSTFFRYLKEDEKPVLRKEDPRQLKLF